MVRLPCQLERGILSFKANVWISTRIAAMHVLHAAHTHAPASVISPDVFAGMKAQTADQ